MSARHGVEGRTSGRVEDRRWSGPGLALVFRAPDLPRGRSPERHALAKGEEPGYSLGEALEAHERSLERRFADGQYGRILY